MAFNETVSFTHMVNFVVTYIRNKNRLFPYTALPGFVRRQGQEIFLFFKASRPTLGPIQTLIRCLLLWG